MTLDLVTITSPSGSIKATLLNYGATIHQLQVKLNKEKETQGFIDVVTGFRDPQDYIRVGTGANPYFGCVVGRVCNRIEYGKFHLNNKDYQLPINNGPNSLHGGIKGFDKVYWNIESQTESTVVFSYLSKDGEEGYPGELKIKVTYSLNSMNEHNQDNDSYKVAIKSATLPQNDNSKLIEREEEELVIDYHVERTENNPHDLLSLVNLTNHAYFNLSGFENPKILDHQLEIFADHVLELNENQTPTRKRIDLRSSSSNSTSSAICKPEHHAYHDSTEIESPFVFKGHTIGSRIKEVQEFRGYDHFYVVKSSDSDSTATMMKNNLSSCHPVQDMKLHVVARNPSNHLTMKVYSTATGFQLYTANWLDASKLPSPKPRNIKDMMMSTSQLSLDDNENVANEMRLNTDDQSGDQNNDDQFHEGYGQYSSFCIETSEPPNAINIPEFKNNIVLSSDQSNWRSMTKFCFS